MERKRKLDFKIVHINGKRKRQCVSCERLFANKQDLLKHLKNEHDVEEGLFN